MNKKEELQKEEFFKKEIEIEFLKNCCTIKNQYKVGQKIKVEMIEKTRPKDGSLKDLFKENEIEKYFKII